MKALKQPRRMKKSGKILPAVEENPEEMAKYKLLEYSDNHDLNLQNHKSSNPDYILLDNSPRNIINTSSQKYQLINEKKAYSTRLNNYKNKPYFMKDSKIQQSYQSYKTSKFIRSTNQFFQPNDYSNSKGFSIIMKSPIATCNYLLLGSQRSHTQVFQPKKTSQFSGNKQHRLQASGLTCSTSQYVQRQKRNNLRLKKMLQRNKKCESANCIQPQNDKKSKQKDYMISNRSDIAVINFRKRIKLKLTDETGQKTFIKNKTQKLQSALRNI